MRNPEVVNIRSTLTILLAALLAVPALAFAVPTAAAAAPVDNCVLVYELHDVRRTYLCVDPKADCPVYTKTVGWRGTTTECVLPEVAPYAAADCGAACLEECQVALWNGAAMAGCTIAHQPYYFQTKCVGGDCSWTIVHCNTYSSGLCEVEQMPPVEHCQYVVRGFELDTGVCVDSDAECEAWLDYRFREYCLTDFGTA